VASPFRSRIPCSTLPPFSIPVIPPGPRTAPLCAGCGGCTYPTWVSQIIRLHPRPSQPGPGHATVFAWLGRDWRGFKRFRSSDHPMVYPLSLSIPAHPRSSLNGVHLKRYPPDLVILSKRASRYGMRARKRGPNAFLRVGVWVEGCPIQCRSSYRYRIPFARVDRGPRHARVFACGAVAERGNGRREFYPRPVPLALGPGLTTDRG